LGLLVQQESDCHLELLVQQERDYYLGLPVQRAPDYSMGLPVPQEGDSQQGLPGFQGRVQVLLLCLDGSPTLASGQHFLQLKLGRTKPALPPSSKWREEVCDVL
jgi:hypothetical protein